MIEVASDGLLLERVVLCPEGTKPWVLVRVRITNTQEHPQSTVHREHWVLSPRFINVGGDSVTRARDVADLVSFRVARTPRGLRADEVRHGEAPRREWEFDERTSLRPTERHSFAQVFGPPMKVALESLGGIAGISGHDGRPLPALTIDHTLEVQPGRSAELWFRFGIFDEEAITDPNAIWHLTWKGLAEWLPTGEAAAAPTLSNEIGWHAAMLTGGLSSDGVVGDLTLNQGSVYSYVFGFNGAARDPLQHALPLIYLMPEAALAVLRNTCAWATPNGELPYALDGAKQPWTSFLQPSDQGLWALWLAAEYVAVTGDTGSLSTELKYHRTYRAVAVPVLDHLRRILRFMLEDVGVGAHGHLHIRNADWNDEAVAASGVPRELMIKAGESVLNSAMAAWVLPIAAGLFRKVGDAGLAQRCDETANALRAAVAASWNGRWFDRAYAPDGTPIGRDSCWLEVQPWALLCGAAIPEQARSLLDTIDSGPRKDSPLGARVRWPVPQGPIAIGSRGENVAGGGIWFAINSTLVWAAARHGHAMAWDEATRMTLSNHSAQYPELWEGTLSGPDSYNSPESDRPGQTWAIPQLHLAMQDFPVNNLHSHAQPLFSYIRLLGIEPDASGTLRVGSGAGLHSPTFQLRPDGHGYAITKGPVVYETAYGPVQGSGGRLEW